MRQRVDPLTGVKLLMTVSALGAGPGVSGTWQGQLRAHGRWPLVISLLALLLPLRRIGCLDLAPTTKTLA